MARFASLHDPERRRTPRFPAEVDVVLVFGERGVPCQTVDVSLYGIYVHTETVVEADRVIQVKVRQGGDDPIEFMGVVRRIVSPRRQTSERPAGMGIEIFAIAEEDWARWRWLIATIAERCEAVYGPDQPRSDGPNAATSPRRHPRFRIPIEAHLTSMPELVRFAARDISAGGIFLQPAPNVSIGDEVEVKLRHPLSGAEFELEGRVVRVEAEGAALEFVNLSNAVRDRLKRFIVTGKRPG